MSDSIIIATFEHKHGRDVRAFANEHGAEAWRQEIAASYWAQASDAPMPACPVEAADRYFELGESYGDEWFSTEAATVEGVKPDPVRDAAPALLVALRCAAITLAECHGHADGKRKQAIRDAIGEARAVIAAAEGRA